MKLGLQVGLSPGHNVLDGEPCCGQMAAWIKMPLGMELGLSPGDFVLDGDPAHPLNFRPMFIIAIVSCRTRVKRLYTCAQIHY